MSAIFTIAKREIFSFFVSPIAYVVLTVWLLFFGVVAAPADSPVRAPADSHVRAHADDFRQQPEEQIAADDRGRWDAEVRPACGQVHHDRVAIAPAHQRRGIGFGGFGQVYLARRLGRSSVVPHASAKRISKSVWRTSLSSSSYMFWRRKSLASVASSGALE